MSVDGKNTPTGPRGAERRRSQRRRALKSVLAAHNHQFNTTPCVMREISETGARLEFDALTPVPPSFMLHVDIDGYQIECKRIWRDGTSVGVEFVGERQPTRIFHSQRLGTSQTALSEQTMRAIEQYGRSEDPDDTRPAVIARHPRHQTPRAPVFGRRI